VSGERRAEDDRERRPPTQAERGVPPTDDVPKPEEHNELGYRIVDEEAHYDERGSQGPGPGEPPPAED
jgi:hypothetical protein